MVWHHLVNTINKFFNIRHGVKHEIYQITQDFFIMFDLTYNILTIQNQFLASC